MSLNWWTLLCGLILIFLGRYILIALLYLMVLIGALVHSSFIFLLNRFKTTVGGRKP